MSVRIHPTAQNKARTASLAALDQMYGYYSFAWQPFAPAREPVLKTAA